MPPGTKLPPFLRSLLTRVSAHHPAPARYGRLNPRPGGRPADPLLRQQLPHGWAQPHYYYQGKPNTSASYPSLSQHLAQRLCAHFTHLLRTLDFTPLLRGAGSVFRGLPTYQTSAYHQSLQSIRHAAARNSASWARFAAVRARPTPGAHVLQGPGLQMARNFSSGAAGPKMAFMITNAPLALRLGGDEIRDMRKASYAAGKPGQASSRRHRHSPRRSHAPVKPVRVELPRMTARQADKAPEQRVNAGNEAASHGLLPAEEMSFYFPEAPNATTAAPAVVTELIIPMEPDLVTILSHPSPFDDEEQQQDVGGRMLDGQLREDTLRTSDAYTLHKQKMRALWRLLEEMERGTVSPYTTPLSHAWRIRDSDVEFLPQTAHHVGYRVRIKGYSLREVKELLVARLGKRHGGWFGQLVREVPMSVAEEPTSPSMGSTSSSSDGGFSMLHAPPTLSSPGSGASSSSSDRFSDDSGFLASPPSPAAASSSSRAWSSPSPSSSSSSSSSSMLHSPPSLSFSATFSSRLRHGRNDEEDEEWLQDSRI